MGLNFCYKPKKPQEKDYQGFVIFCIFFNADDTIIIYNYFTGNLTLPRVPPNLHT